MAHELINAQTHKRHTYTAEHTHTHVHTHMHMHMQSDTFST